MSLPPSSFTVGSPLPVGSLPPVGIDRLGLATPSYRLPMSVLSDARQTPLRKYLVGLGQEQMGVLAPDEDIITLAANAAREALSGENLDNLHSIVLATESGIDQSKAGSLFVHRLLGLPSTCMAYELKQACCSSTVALQNALQTVALNPSKKVLVVASDVARYGFQTPGEPTQGAGAVAILVSAHPRLLVTGLASGQHTEELSDFWRPNYMDTAVVDGKYSIRVYLRALEEAFARYHQTTGLALRDFARFCFHLPFTKMGDKAYHQLLRHGVGAEEVEAAPETQLVPGQLYNRLTGNTYTASLPLSLMSMLENDPTDLTGSRLGLFSYGSGSMGIFFSGIVQDGYRDALFAETHRKQLKTRPALDLATYERWFDRAKPNENGDLTTELITTGSFRFAGMEGHRRVYEPTSKPAVTNSSAVAVI